MKIAIINSQHTRSPTSSRLRDAALKRGHTVELYAAAEMLIGFRGAERAMFYNGSVVGLPDVVIARLGAASDVVGLSIVSQFELAGVPVINSVAAVQRARDKFLTAQIMANNGVAIPATALPQQSSDIRAAVSFVGGAPVIVKLLHGTQGIGVMYAESAAAAEAIAETVMLSGKSCLIQKFVNESRGKDVRVFVVGGKVAAAMRRSALGDEFRSNVHRGGVTQGIAASPELAAVAIKAADLMGLRIAGVDILESAAGPLVMEVNASPGLEGIEGATGVDIAALIVEEVERAVGAN